jgi:hypothetical protein
MLFLFFMERHYKLKQQAISNQIKMTDKNEITTSKEMGLIKHLSKRNTQLKNQTNYVEELTKNALEMIYELGGDVFDYAVKTGMTGKAYGMSEIRDYYNKKGVMSLVHYNKYGYYVGTVKQLGDKPIPALYQTGICKELFVYDPVINDFIPKKIETPKEETKPKELKKRRLVIVD